MNWMRVGRERARDAIGRAASRAFGWQGELPPVTDSRADGWHFACAAPRYLAEKLGRPVDFIGRGLSSHLDDNYFLLNGFINLFMQEWLREAWNEVTARPLAMSIGIAAFGHPLFYLFHNARLLYSGLPAHSSDKIDDPAATLFLLRAGDLSAKTDGAKIRYAFMLDDMLSQYLYAPGRIAARRTGFDHAVVASAEEVYQIIFGERDA